MGPRQAKTQPNPQKRECAQAWSNPKNKNLNNFIKTAMNNYRDRKTETKPEPKTNPTVTTDTTTEIAPTPPPKDEVLTMIEVPTLPGTTTEKTKATHHDNEMITKVEIHKEDTTLPKPNMGKI